MRLAAAILITLAAPIAWAPIAWAQDTKPPRAPAAEPGTDEQAQEAVHSKSG